MEPIVKTLLEVLDAFNREDFDALAELVDPDVVYRIPGRMPLSGEHRGVEAVTAALRQLAEHGGRTLDVLNAYAYRFSGGKMTEAQVFPGDLHHVEAFFTE